MLQEASADRHVVGTTKRNCVLFEKDHFRSGRIEKWCVRKHAEEEKDSF